MPRSILNRAAIAYLLTAASLASPLLAQSPVDDASLKRQFQKGLTDIYNSNDFPAPAAIRRQLNRKTPHEGNVPKAGPKDTVEASNLYNHARKATLVIGHLFLCDKCDNWHLSIAGGVLISPGGLALTNHHVLAFDRASIFGAMTSDGKVYPIVEVLAASRKDDVALIRIESDKPLPYVSLANSAPVGTSVYAVSHPDSHFYALTAGDISRYSMSPKEKTQRLEITANFARGSSGCGVYNKLGQLVGLISSTKSIYYHQDIDVQKHLQMVIKTCVPLSGIKSLFQPVEK